MRTVLSLDDPRAVRRDVAGGKMATLARLHQAGFRVPDGFTVTTDVHTSRMAWRHEVEAAYLRLRSPSVAVRSSATDEDLPGRSAAGMYRTALNVRGPAQVLAAVDDCLASADSAHRTFYSAGAGPAALAVGVLLMVRPRVSGVCFDVDPLGSGHLVIEAVRGPLGPLVDGRIVPHHLALDVTDGVVVSEGGDHGADVLDLATARAVGRLTRAIATELGSDVDVEWALDEGGLVVLQARPAGAPAAP